MTTGNDQLDQYHELETFLAQFGALFRQAVAGELGQRSEAYQVYAGERGFSVRFHDLTAELTYRAIGRDVRIVCDPIVTQKTFTLSAGDEPVLLEKIPEGETTDFDATAFISTFLNPVLEESLKERLRVSPY